MRPSYKKPYYYIHNVNTSTTVPTNPITYASGKTPENALGLGTGTDRNQNGQGLSKSLLTAYANATNETPAVTGDLVERIAGARYGNASSVRLEIRYGKDNSLFQLEDVYIDYIKTPQHIRLTQEELDLTEDTSQMMEFPDYVCQEIINELVKLVLENSGDSRLQSNIAVNQSIANPAQQ